jgi:hypothetical protein
MKEKLTAVMKKMRINSLSFLFSKKGSDILTMKIISKVAVFNYKEFESSLLEMNDRESDVADFMVPNDLAKVLKFVRKDSFSVKELLDQNFQLDLIVAAADYMRPELFENHTILDEITGNVEYANPADEDFLFF